LSLFVENQETLIAVTNLLNLSLMFASAALFPTTIMPDWLKTIADYNPITWAVDARRQLVFNNPEPIYDLSMDIIALLIFASIIIGLSVAAARKTLRG
jgi:ABC-2 type transport system permease protein